MLEELCKRDKDWRRMAFHICKSKDIADDIVQDMYIKFSNYNKPINEYYIFFALKSIFLDYLRKEKTKVVSNLKQIASRVQSGSKRFSSSAEDTMDKKGKFKWDSVVDFNDL